jgi:beta-lactamase regulating signal transducer with metallopeptidase domain
MPIAAIAHAQLPAQIFAQTFAERMLNTMVEGCAIALFAWLLLRWLGRQSSSTRFAVWFSALVAIAALPLFEGVSPIHSSAAGSSTIESPAAASKAFSVLRLPASFATAIFLIWAVVAIAGLVKIAFSFLRLRKLRRSCEVVNPENLHPVLRETLNEFDPTRCVQICISAEVRVPAAIGFFNPAIVLPPWALRELDPLELRAVLLHEQAHLRRWDDWTNLAQQILRAVFFFHPAVWFVGRSLSTEREMACDDFVLAKAEPAAYARCLLSVAEKTFLRRGLALALAIAGRLHQTSRRVARILQSDRPTTTGVFKPALALIAAFSAICLVSVPRTPQLVEFEASDSAISASSANRLTRADNVGASAKIIPASFHVTPATSIAAGRRAPDSTPTKESRKQFSVLRVIARPQRAIAIAHLPTALSANAQPVKFANIRSIQSSLLHAQTAADSIVAPRSLLVVMQSEQIDNSGRMFWSVSVWRLTLFHPAGREVPKGITPKST